MRYLFVDYTNIFCRYYSALPTLSLNGDPIGGIFGSLYCLRKVCEVSKPNQIIVVFDGEGGSQKRRAIFENYKQKSKPIKIKTNYLDLKNQEQNLHFQFNKLMELLECLPVHIIRLKNIEADDVIAYLCNHFKEDQRVILSGDKDFYQMLDEKTIIYCPSKKIFKNKSSCIQEFGIHPNNFALAKAIAGDKSDTIPGVHGIGFKTLIKLMPEFEFYQPIDFTQFFKLCTERVSKSKKFQSILDSKDLIIRNFDLVQLNEQSIIGAMNIERIKSILDKSVSFLPTALRVKIIENRFPPFSDIFYSTFGSVRCKMTQQ